MSQQQTYLFPVCHSCGCTNVESKNNCSRCGTRLLMRTCDLFCKEICYCGKPTYGAPRCGDCKRVNFRLKEAKHNDLPPPLPFHATSPVPKPALDNSMRVINGLAQSCLCGERNHIDRKTCQHCNKCLLVTYGPVGCREFKEHVDLHMGNTCPSCQLVDQKENTRCGRCRQSLFYQYVNPVPQSMEYHWRCPCDTFNDQARRHCMNCDKKRWS